MTAKIIDGKALATEIRKKLANQIAGYERAPRLAVILVGDNPASQIYVHHKTTAATEVGIQSDTYQLSPVMTQDALISFIEELNQNPEVDAILVQLPLPAHMNADEVLDTIHPDKDADGLTSRNLGRLFAGYPAIKPCTPLACMALIKQALPDTDGANAVIVGRSRLVGKPLAQLLLEAQCTVTQAHSHTRDLKNVCRQADILVAATGRTGLIRGDFIKPGAVVIDVGINRTAEGKVTGDVVFEEAELVAGAITPVPGGVGPMTVTMLLQNVIDIFLKKACGQ